MVTKLTLAGYYKWVWVSLGAPYIKPNTTAKQRLVNNLNEDTCTSYSVMVSKLTLTDHYLWVRFSLGAKYFWPGTIAKLIN